MPQTKKVFPLRLDAVTHTTIKKGAEDSGRSMHQFILDAALNEIDKQSTYELLEAAYKFIKGGPANQLEEEIFQWLMNHK
jgi:uncharacterized protein (DUF1778 family)